MLNQERDQFRQEIFNYFGVTNFHELFLQDSRNFVRRITSVDKFKSDLKRLTSYLDHLNSRPGERLYHIIFDLYEVPKCRVCGQAVKFTNQFHVGYRQYCSDSCRKLDYGNINQKARTTYYNKTGYSNPSQDPDVKQKKKITYLKNYGKDHYFSTDEFRQKVIDYSRSNYGCDYSFQRADVKNPSQITYASKTGYSHPSLNPEVVQKRKETYFTKTGYYCSFQNPEIQSRIKQHFIDTLGVDNPAKSEIIQQKQKETFRRKFFERIVNSSKIRNLYQPLFDVTEYRGVKSTKYSWKCLKCGTEFVHDIDNGNLPRCSTCFPPQTSISEKDLADFCYKYYNQIDIRNRSIITPYEIDVYIPDIRLGIELNGNYFHSELAGNKNQYYHQYKLLLALQNNINLIQIFEDEWVYKQNIVKSILLSKIGKIQNRVFARKCKVTSISEQDAKDFYDNNHLQGYIGGEHLGLVYNNELVSMLTAGSPRFNPNYDLEIYRFCHKVNIAVIGGLSKLLSKLIEKFNCKSIITYADARYGLGIGYYKSGFQFVEITEPNYFYMKNYNNRLSRMQFQKKLLESKLDLYDDSLTEWENMQLNGYDRIWDCGNFVYVKKI